MKSAKPHLVWIGHVGGHTGLARVSDNLLLRLQARWRVTVVGISVPADYAGPFTVIPARFLEDWMGRLVLRKLIADDPPDVVCLMMDPAPAMLFFPYIPRHIPVVAHMPVDAENILDAPKLDRLACGIFLTQFGLHEARTCGYTGQAVVLGHGVDPLLYAPQNRQEARERVGVPLDGFVIGNVNRNQPRKRMDITLLAFREFLVRTGAKDAYLYLHCAPQDIGWDLAQLARYWGIAERVIFPRETMKGLQAPPELCMPWVYSALDVQVTTTQGEGFGLTCLEGMACGIPQIVPAFAALGEWPEDAVYRVPVVHQLVTTAGTNLIEWFPDSCDVAYALEACYKDSMVRETYAQLGYTHARKPQFSWDRIAEQFHAILTGVLHGKENIS